MNTKNLNLIFENYISRFERINEPDGANENYKWFAVHNFQEVFDIDAPDFASMLKKACRATENMIDNYMQPFSGLVVMAEKDGEAETIREMFRQLYADDGGDLTARQQKITAFLASCDELLAKHYPSSHLYKNDQRSAMAYLWFYDPDNNYMCKTTEAQYLANAAEFYEEWGTYATFRLDVYYRFCDALIDEIRKCPALLAIHQSRFEGHEAEMHPDTQLHILAFDIIYCARTYGLYTGVEIKDISSEDRRLYQQRKDKAIELAGQLAVAEENMMLLQDGISEAETMVRSGAAIRHKSFGVGSLEEFDGHYLVIRFPGFDVPKKFELTSALGNGFLILDIPSFSTFFEKYGTVLKQAMRIPQQVKSAEAALKPYATFLD